MCLDHPIIGFFIKEDGHHIVVKNIKVNCLEIFAFCMARLEPVVKHPDLLFDQKRDHVQSVVWSKQVLQDCFTEESCKCKC